MKTREEDGVGEGEEAKFAVEEEGQGLEICEGAV